jgi:hypothetical protein
LPVAHGLTPASHNKIKSNQTRTTTNTTFIFPFYLTFLLCSPLRPSTPTFYSLYPVLVLHGTFELNWGGELDGSGMGMASGQIGQSGQSTSDAAEQGPCMA